MFPASHPVSERLGAPASRPTTLILKAARRAATAFADVVYPPSCIVCQAATAEPAALCAQCWGRLRLIERPYCERLGTPFAVDAGAALLSPAAIANPPVYARRRRGGRCPRFRNRRA
jgi:hypothetical protein